MNKNLSKFSDNQLKIYRIIFIVLGTILLLFSLLTIVVSFFIGLIGLFAAILSFSFAKSYRSELNLRSSKRAENEKQKIIDEFASESIQNNASVQSAINEPEIEPLDIRIDINVKPDIITERHHIAGTSYRQREIKELGVLNPDYDMSKREIINCCMDGERIYQLFFSPSSVVLEEEPSNPHDPNAVKVLIDSVHVGYIKSGSCSHIKKLIKDEKIEKIDADIRGGKYKIVTSFYDDERDKDIYEIEKDETDFFVSITITLK